MADSGRDSDDENDNDKYLLSTFYGPAGVLSHVCLYSFPGAAVKN